MCKGYHYPFLFGSSLNSYLIHMAWIALVISYSNLKLMQSYCKPTNNFVTITVICVWICKKGLIYTAIFLIFRLCNSICVLLTALKFGRRTLPISAHNLYEETIQLNVSLTAEVMPLQRWKLDVCKYKTPLVIQSHIMVIQKHIYSYRKLLYCIDNFNIYSFTINNLLYTI